MPPIKDGGNSIWGKPDQIPRLQELRRKFLAELDGRPVLCAKIRLTVRVHVNRESQGDLDNMVSGICDGLQSCDRDEWPAWQPAEFATIHPRVKVAIENDRYVVAIDAQRFIEPGEPWYSVAIEGE